jgi:hypothetical protein
LAQVPGLWTVENFAATEEEEGIVLYWLPFAIEKKEQNNDN